MVKDPQESLFLRLSVSKHNLISIVLSSWKIPSELKARKDSRNFIPVSFPILFHPDNFA